MTSEDDLNISAKMKRPNVSFLRPHVLFGLILLVLAVIAWLLWSPTDIVHLNLCPASVFVYNDTYPLTPPIKDLDNIGKVTYNIALVTDMDQASKQSNNDGKPAKWKSNLLLGTLTYDSVTTVASITFNSDPIVLKSTLSAKDRGMELSELVVFNGKLYTIDDRTGIVYEIANYTSSSEVRLIPWVILPNGDGLQPDAFKAEWMVAKDGHLYVGGLGKEWTTTTGELVNLYPQWIKRIDPQGRVEHIDWVGRYNALRHTAQCDYPGYLIHEAAVWSTAHRSWIFLPRRSSRDKYDETADERRGTNLMLFADEDFKSLMLRYVGGEPLVEQTTHGFSAARFIPHTLDKVLVALMSEEINGHIASYITVLNTDGHVLMKEQRIPGDFKYEGIEFV